MLGQGADPKVHSCWRLDPTAVGPIAAALASAPACRAGSVKRVGYGPELVGRGPIRALVLMGPPKHEALATQVQTQATGVGPWQVGGQVRQVPVLWYCLSQDQAHRGRGVLALVCSAAGARSRGVEPITYIAAATGVVVGLLLGLLVGEVRAGRAYRRGVADEHERSGGCWVKQQVDFNTTPPGLN